MKERRSRSTPDEDEDEVEDFPSAYYEDEEGVKVHTVPGKPSTIEVEYSGGPILISVDTQGDSLDSMPTQKTSSSSSSSRYSTNCFLPDILSFLWLLTALAQEVMRSHLSVCLSIFPFVSTLSSELLTNH